MEPFSFDALTLLGVGVFGGILGAAVFQRLHIPQVVGYIVIGLIVGEMGLNLISREAVEGFQSVNLFALGIIGFLVGGELHIDIFRRQGKQLFAILFAEGLGAFVLVGASVGWIVYVVAGDVRAAVAAGLVFGAIASATDPASTLNVLWEYRSRGVFTTTLIAIVALDDALAMTLYGIGTAVAQIVTGESTSLFGEVGRTLLELSGAILLGAVSGGVLRLVISRLKRPENTFASAVGAILLIIGVTASLDMDVILASMTMGVTLTNLAPRRSKELFSTIRSFATPIYVIFFVLVGARLQVDAMPAWLWLVVGVYVVGRSIGKIGGAYVGARMTGADSVVQKYVGLGLFAQGGIAVGLSIMAGAHLGKIPVTDEMSLGDMIIFGITASTFAVQILGPPLIKLSSRLAGELGRDVTEEDVIESWTVSDVMTKDIEPIVEQMPLTKIVDTFANNDHLVYPVVDRSGILKGVISLDDLKEVLAHQDTWDWVLAADVMADVVDKVSTDAPLATALAFMNETGAEEIPVVNGENQDKAVGILDQRSARIRINDELLRQRQAT